MPGGTIEMSGRESEGKRGTETEREVGDERGRCEREGEGRRRHVNVSHCTRLRYTVVYLSCNVAQREVAHDAMLPDR